jgi:hypothetical protein
MGICAMKQYVLETGEEQGTIANTGSDFGMEIADHFGLCATVVGMRTCLFEFRLHPRSGGPISTL